MDRGAWWTTVHAVSESDMTEQLTHFLVAQLVKNPPAMWETWVQSLGWEDPLEKGTITTPVFWPGKFHGLYHGVAELDMTE